MENVREITIKGKSLKFFEIPGNPVSSDGKPLDGAWIWDSAIVFAKWMDISPSWNESILSGKTVVEIGAGMGLPGITAASLGSRVFLTDKAEILPGLQRNVDVNCLSERVKVQELIWGEEVSFLDEKVDFVFGSDILYSVEAVQSLCKTLKELMSSETRIFVSYELRQNAKDVFGVLKDNGFSWKRVPNEQLHPDWCCNDIGIFQFFLH